jgi:hypothetical protein
MTNAEEDEVEVDVAAAPAVPAGAPVIPFMTFHFPPTHPDVYDVNMGSRPMLRVSADDIFLAVSAALPWVPLPPAPAAPTHYVCQYHEVECLLHSVFSMGSEPLLGSCPFLRYDLPSALCGVWDACVDIGGLDISRPINDLSALAAQLYRAALRAGNDPRLSLTFDKVGLLAAPPVTLAFARRWMYSIFSRHFADSTSDPCRVEAFLLRLLTPRFLRVDRDTPNSRFSQVLESSRVVMSQSSVLMTQTLDLEITNADNYGAPVARYWSDLLPPLVLTKYPTEGHVLAFVSDCHNYAYGPALDKHRAFVNLLPNALLHYEHLRNELDDKQTRSAGVVYVLLQRLADAYMESSGPLEDDPSILTLLDRRVQLIAPSRMAAHIDPDTASARVQWHVAESTRVRAAVKADLKSQATGTPSGFSSRAVGLNTEEFRTSCARIATLLLVPHPKDNAVIQAILRGGSRLLVLCFLGRVPPIAGYPIFVDISPFKSRLPSYLGWSLSSDNMGVIPSGKEGKSVSEAEAKLLFLGNWAGPELQILNMCKAWEATLKNAGFVGLPESDWYLQDQHLRCLRKFGLRVFSAMHCAGTGIGSFGWVVDTGQEILDMRAESGANAADIQALVQWWFHAALKEAGLFFSTQLRADSNFALPIQNIFLPASALCISMLPAKRAVHLQWDKFVNELPNTVAGLMSGHSVASGVPINATAPSASHSSVVSYRTAPIQGKLLIYLLTCADNCLYPFTVSTSHAHRGPSLSDSLARLIAHRLWL